MAEEHKSTYTEWLEQAYRKAQDLVQADDVEAALDTYISEHPELTRPLMTGRSSQPKALGLNVAQGVATIVGNFRSNKYIYSILLTALVEKLVHPSQDIRCIQEGKYEDPNDASRTIQGYSNRSTDQSYVTPFLKRHNLTHMAASGMESGRNLERPIPHNLEFVTRPRGRLQREAYLGILHAVQVDNVPAFPVTVLLMARDMVTKATQVYTYPTVVGLTIEEIHEAVMRHHAEAAGNGRSRLPVLAIQAVYQSLVQELSRYSECELRNPPNRHTGNDKKGWIGDIQIDTADGVPFEAVEVKSGKSITSDMVRKLPDMFQGRAIDRYYILSNADPYIDPKDADDIRTLTATVRRDTGCQVIVNGLNRSLWYYLRLIADPSEFVMNYTAQLDSDQDVNPEHRQLWANILQDLDEAAS